MSTLNNDILRALKRVATERGYELEIATEEPDRVEIWLLEERHVERRLQAHRLKDGRWINARWNTDHKQWQSTDLVAKAADWRTHICYVFALQLDDLASACCTYHTPELALLSVIRDPIVL